MQQLDIFSDSRDRMLINALADAVAAGDLAAIDAAAAALRHEFPDDTNLAPGALLRAALAAEGDDTPWPDAAALDAAREQLVLALAPAAVLLLGRDASAPWLAERWRRLARRAHALPFDGSDAHAAPLWLAAQAWHEAAAAVEAIESWRRKPLPVAWMAEARFHTRGVDGAWPLLAELAWLAPSLLQPLLARLPDPRLARLARRFDAEFDAGAWPWWPAWLLVEQPLLAAPLSAAQADRDTPPERGFKLMHALLRLEREGRHHDVVAARRTLQALNAELFAAYMATR